MLVQHYKISTLAKLLDLTKQTILNAIRRGDLQASRIKGKTGGAKNDLLLVPEPAVDAWMKRYDPAALTLAEIHEIKARAVQAESKVRAA